MACVVRGSQRMWSGKRDAEGHREYKVAFLVESDSSGDGPACAMQAVGLPLPGSFWFFDNDLDIWATCKLDMEVERHQVAEGQRGYWWIVGQTFSTKSDAKKCKDAQIEDPLLEPQKISGNFQKYTEEATFDRFGLAIKNSAFEQIRGPQVEFDKSRPIVRIEQNVLNLELDMCASMIDTVNDSILWGFLPRKIKLSSFDWEKKYYGQCYAYYTRKFEFEIRYEGFDRDILDEGTKVLRGAWVRDPMSPRYTDWLPLDGMDPTNPNHFMRFKDWNGELSSVILNGAGRPIDTGDGTGTIGPMLAGSIHVEKYGESNFLLLGIPTSF